MNTQWLRSWRFLLLVAPLVVFIPGCSEAPASVEVSAHGEFVIEPNVAVGPIRAGMSTNEVIAALGEPQRRTANSLVYPKLGLAVMPGEDGTAQVVMCGDVTGISGPFVKAFKGKTGDGIGMESSREEVVKAFGEPSQVDTFPGGQQSMQYAEQGITFTLQRGKVHHMIVRLRGNPMGIPEKSVSVDVAPPR